MTRHEMLSKEFHQLKTGVMIRCRHHGPTDYSGSRIKATIQKERLKRREDSRAC